MFGAKNLKQQIYAITKRSESFTKLLSWLIPILALWTAENFEQDSLEEVPLYPIPDS